MEFGAEGESVGIEVEIVGGGAGRGSEKLRDALDVVRDATQAIGAVTNAVKDPSPASVTEALTQAALVVARRSDGGLGGALSPALGVLGSVMRSTQPSRLGLKRWSLRPSGLIRHGVVRLSLTSRNVSGRLLLG